MSAVKPFLDVLDPDSAAQLFLTLGGAELYLPRHPKGRGRLEACIGPDLAARLAAELGPGQWPRVPLANAWLMEHLHGRGMSTADIARTIRRTDSTVRRFLAHLAARQSGPRLLPPPD